jgi:hypothetical protein
MGDDEDRRTGGMVTTPTLLNEPVQRHRQVGYNRSSGPGALPGSGRRDGDGRGISVIHRIVLSVPYIGRLGVTAVDGLTTVGPEFIGPTAPDTAQTDRQAGYFLKIAPSLGYAGLEWEATEAGNLKSRVTPWTVLTPRPGSTDT